MYWDRSSSPNFRIVVFSFHCNSDWFICISRDIYVWSSKTTIVNIWFCEQSLSSSNILRWQVLQSFSWLSGDRHLTNEQLTFPVTRSVSEAFCKQEELRANPAKDTSCGDDPKLPVEKRRWNGCANGTSRNQLEEPVNGLHICRVSRST